jgi:hypothetical protein
LAVSLGFVYMLLSLMCTSASELIASILALRQRTLSSAVEHLLGHTALRKAFYEHPLIKGIAHGRRGEPSYIPKDLFSATVVDLLAKSPEPKSNLQEGLTALLRGTTAEAAVKEGFDKLGAETATVKSALGAWFDDSMSRASGLYKRKAQVMVFSVAALLVVGLNADTVAIAKALWVRPELRSAIADSAGKYVAQGMPVVDKTENTATTEVTNKEGTTGTTGTTNSITTSAPAAVDATQALIETNKRLATTTNELLGLGLPLGWTDDVLRPGETWPTKLLGLLLTILACSLGAPFWFDLLGKLVNVRSSGKRPANG